MGSVLGTDDETALKQTLGDTGGMSGSLSLGILAGGTGNAATGNAATGEPRLASTPTKLRSSTSASSTSPTVQGTRGRGGAL